VRNNKLQDLVESLPSVLRKSREPNTISTYQVYSKAWEKWCTDFPEIKPLPTEEQYLILYILAMLQSNKSFPVINASISAIKYFHAIVGFSIGNSTIFRHSLEAAKRICRHVSNKKKAITVSDLEKIEKTLTENASCVL